MEIFGSSLLDSVDGEVIGEGGGGYRRRRVNFERGEDSDPLIGAQPGILITVHSTNPKNSIILKHPGIELLGKVQRFSIIVLVELYDSHVVGVLPDLGDLVLEVEIVQLGHVAALEIVDGPALDQDGR